MKIKKALIIRRLKVQQSMEYAQMCAESCEKFGVPYEFIDGIEFMESEDAFKAVGCFLNPAQNDLFRGRGVSKGNNNCHASHIKAWRRLLEIGEPCAIIEHDVLFRGNICNVDIVEDAVNILGLRVNSADGYTPISEATEMVKINKHTGGHAYALTPKVTSELVQDAETNGVLTNVDELINCQKTYPLYIMNPIQCVCWPRFSTREFQDENKYYQTMAPNTNFGESFTKETIEGFRR